MTIQAGTRLGPYEVIESIGAGGMGEVYRARDTRLERTVAIKVMPAVLASSLDFRVRFQREAKAISALNHPHICTLYDVGETASPDGPIAYLVMEYLEGETLASRLTRGALPLEAALEYACQIADALDKAHRLGIVHRDLKPPNVFLLRTSGASGPGASKLLDFGLAKIGAVAPGTIETQLATSPPSMTAQPEPGAPLTAQGTILGTFQYMSPEQVEGREADARSDIWAFGCVLYEMLTGRRAFEARSQASLIASIMERQPSPLAELAPMTPPALDRLVRTCLHKDADDRFHTAHDLRLQLQWIRDGGSAAGVSAPVVARRRRHDHLLFAALAGALAIVAAGAAWWLKPAPPAHSVSAGFTYELPDEVFFTRSGRRLVAISPDGTRIAFIANQRIYLRPLRSNEAHPIRGSDVDPLDLAFSPDGQWIVFASPPSVGLELETAKLRKIPVGGGVPQTLCESGAPLGLDWDNDQIVFANNRGIHVVPDTGGQPETIFASDKPQIEAFAQPQLVNDGRDVLYSVRRGISNFTEGQVVVQSRSGGERRVVVPTGMNGRLLPEGVLLYAQGSTVFAQSVSPTTLEPVGAAVQILEGVRQAENTGVSQFSVSEAGTLVYVPGGGTLLHDLVWVNRKGDEEPTGAPPQNYRLPRVSPDGTRIAFSSGDADRDIFIWELARKTLSRLTTGPEDDNYPVWTRDSRTIIYRHNAGADGGGRGELVRRAADGSGAIQRLTTSPVGETPLSLLPGDGRLLVRVSSEDNAIGSLSVFPFDQPGEMREVIGAAAGRPSNGEVSPDGRWIAYQSREASTRDEIYVRSMSNPDAGRWQVSSGGGARPVWAPGGRELIYIANGVLTSVLVTPTTLPATFAYSSPQPLGDWAGDYEYGPFGRAYDISPDGQRFLVLKGGQSRATTKPSLQVVTHWRTEVDAALRGK